MSGGERDDSMKWEQARQEYPDCWMLFEAVCAHSDGDQRVVDDLVVISAFNEAEQAMREYLTLHKQEPQRELYLAHTSRRVLEIKERRWAGVRAAV